MIAVNDIGDHDLKKQIREKKERERVKRLLFRFLY